ncbi:MAG: GYD domain-containing protein [Dehalococcoidia bacterium]
MAVFVALGRATEAGKRRTLEGLAERHRKAVARAEAAGARVLASYALLGPYDYLTLLEAPDIETVARVLIREAARGNVNYEIHPALAMAEFARLVGEEDNPAALRIPRTGRTATPDPEPGTVAERPATMRRGYRRVARTPETG